MPQKEPKMPRGGPVIHAETQYPETGEPRSYRLNGILVTVPAEEPTKSCANR